MECDCYLHNYLHDEITVIDSSFQCLQRASRIHSDKYRSELYSIIDKMGSLSAKAQSLPGAITTGMKLMYSEHRLYILKDIKPESRQVIGILKIGRKKLFIYDTHGVQHELEPLCVLDFYVHESRQRQGCGRKLFDFMLQREGVIPRHLAIDRPSHKFSAFLAKHYLLTNVIPQMNNFVIFQGFFRDRTDYPRGRRHRSAVDLNTLERNNTSRANGIAQQPRSLDRRPSPTLPRLPSARTKRLSASSHPQPPAPAVPPPHSQSSPEIAPNLNVTTNPKSVTMADDLQIGDVGVERRVSTDGIKHKEDSPTTRRLAPKTEDPFNGHQEYLTRNGRLRVGSSNPRATTAKHSREHQRPSRDSQSAHYGRVDNGMRGTVAEQADANWTMYSVAKPNNYTYQVGLNRNYKHTRLW